MEQAKARPLVRFSRRLTVVCAWAYLVCLIALCCALAFIGERYWLTTALLYVPRVIYAFPCALLAVALWLLKAQRLLWTQAAALLVVVLPLMGFVLPWPGSARGPTLKLMSFNVNTAQRGIDRLLRAVDEQAPDIVLMQESPWPGPLQEGLAARFPHVESSTDFVFASRFSVLERSEPDLIPMADRERSPRFIRYLVDTNLGPIAVFAVHPVSPRGALNANTYRGVLKRAGRGTILEGDAKAVLQANAELRIAQLSAAVTMARAERHPVVIAGDTNVPGLSPVLRRQLGGYTDAFRSSSWGFGYTFPAEHPFLRLDRVLLGPELAASDFRVGCPDASDHLCVSVRLSRR